MPSTRARSRASSDWRPAETFETGIAKTVRWYLDNAQWVARVRDGSYREWVEQQYGAAA